MSIMYAYDVFFDIEREIRKRLSVPLEFPESVIAGNEDVQFFWSMLSAEWEEESGDVVVNQYIKIRGFSSASGNMIILTSSPICYHTQCITSLAPSR